MRREAYQLSILLSFMFWDALPCHTYSGLLSVACLAHPEIIRNPQVGRHVHGQSTLEDYDDYVLPSTFVMKADRCSMHPTSIYSSLNATPVELFSSLELRSSGVRKTDHGVHAAIEVEPAPVYSFGIDGMEQYKYITKSPFYLSIYLYVTTHKHIHGHNKH